MAIKNIYTAAPTGLLAVVIMAVSTVTAVQAQTTTLPARLAARPLTQGDVTAYKLPSTTQLSGGLFTVGLGAPLYLEAQIDSTIPASDVTGVTWTLSYQPAGSKAVLAESPLGANVPIYEPSDRLVYQVAGRKLLRPDVEGAYIVDVTITMTNSAPIRLGQTFVAATYMGIGTCTLCHSGLLPQNLVQPWSQTLHNQIFKDGINGVASDHYSASCLPCHTVGYDTNPAAAGNHGFAATAAQLKWVFPTPKAGNWDALPDALKNVGNIQCENCHGPGSVHVTGSFNVGISVSLDSGVCSQCHDAPTHHIKSAEWNNSVHAIATRHPSGPGEESCVGCHTGRGFISRINGDKTRDTTYSAINCQACHEPHGVTTPGANPHQIRSLQPVTLPDGTKVTTGGMGLLCMNCHQSRQNAATYAATAAASARFGPHHGPQSDMLQGVNGFTYGTTIASSPHRSAVKDTCVTCHMQTVAEADPAFTHAGGHTFKPGVKADGTNPAIDLVGACQTCHGQTLTAFNFPAKDYDGDGTIDGVQTEVQHLLDKLALQLPPVGQAKTALTIDSSWTRAQLEAAYNWQFVQEDGSRGIHNTEYAVGLLKASLADLAAKK